ncbi:MAG TPA: M14 metallopeptidase family protein [Pyrinomonadaceae bacterium]|nr:M14 metallopeptidase family protein [Pyrinomonadaceae bacterium]
MLLSGSGATRAQSSRRSFSRVGLPTPSSLLGFTPGDDRTIADWRQITDYFARLDKASDRVLVKNIGPTTKGRPLIAAFISARENILALNKYQEIQRRLADPRTVQTNAARDALVSSGKVVVAISCSIHSTEIVASQMSMQLAYELASAQDQTTREILQNTILILIPSANPDGIDIVANWYRKTLGTKYEGQEPPELYHHYAGHDDNRDWFMLNLLETRAISRLFWQEWFPQIVYDIHQQGPNGSRFFIPPFFDPANPNIPPLLLRQVGLIGHKIAADLQAAGIKGVVTNSTYDTWWHGGFRTAPYFHNSIGILSEAASAKLMTPTTVTEDQLKRANRRGLRNALEASTNFPDPWPGGQWRARDIMNLEMISSRAVLSLAAKFRADYLKKFFELGRAATMAGTPNDPIAYIMQAGQGRDEAVAKLLDSLISQGMEVYRLDRELHASFGPQVLQRTNSSSEKIGTYRRIMNHTTGMHEVPLGSYIIFLNQPQRQNVLALFEPQIYPNRIDGSGQVEQPYDVAGWTLPMQMGVEAAGVMAIQEAATERRLTLMRDPNEVRKDLALPLKTGDASPIANPLKNPVRIALYKSWTANMDEGWTRFVFDTYNVPYASLTNKDIQQEDLPAKYNVIVLPSQRAREIVEGNPITSHPPEFAGGIGEAGVAKLKAFVAEGGTLICFDASCELALKQFNLPLSNALEGVKSSEFYCPGSVVALDVDTSQPLGRGLSPATDAYFLNSSAFELVEGKTADSVRVVARYARENVLRSGWLLGEARLRDKIALAQVRVGKGQVILFAFRPQHRGQTWGTFPFIWNALASAAISR